MASKVQIINRALSNIGARSIVSPEENTKNANIMRLYYSESLRDVLSECLWTFATKRVLLNQLNESPDWTTNQLNYVYQRPSDCIRVFGWNNVDSIVREESDKILSDGDGLGILYVFYQEDTTKFSSKFTSAFADKLASDASFMILNSSTKAVVLLEKYEEISLPNAMSENAQISTPETPDDNDWLVAKFSGESSINSREFRYR